MDLEIFIEQDIRTGRSKVWLRNQTPATTEYFNYDGENLMGVTRQNCSLDKQDEIKPLFELPNDFCEEIIKAFADYANRSNIQTEERSFLEGELLATKKHLDNVVSINERIVNHITK